MLSVAQEIHDRVEAAEASVHSTQQLLQDYDLMCQKAFELSRKLSLAESENKQLRSKLAHVKEDLAAAADELAEHRELQMVYDKQCQVCHPRMQTLSSPPRAGSISLHYLGHKLLSHSTVYTGTDLLHDACMSDEC